MLYCKKVFHTIQNVRFKGKVSYNLSWKFWDILYIWRFLLPPTSFGDSLSELLGLCFPPWVSCSSTTREYTKFLCHWLWLIMANWHQMPCSQNWQQNINALHDLCFHVSLTVDWIRETVKGKFCTIKRFGKLSDIPHFTLIIMTNIEQRICSFISRLKGKIQKGIPARHRVKQWPEASRMLTSICLKLASM